MAVNFLDPRAEPTLAVEPYDAKTLRPDQAHVIGLLANNFPDSIPFLDQVELALRPHLPAGVTIARYAKPNASAPMSAQLLETMARECSAIVTAYGH